MDELEEKRKILDIIDESIIRFISQRMEVVREIAEIKKDNGLQPLDKNRKNKMLKAREQLAESLGLDKKLIRRIYVSIHEHSVKIQKNIIEKKTKTKNKK